jgi:phage baseplate assembly protein W
MMTTAIYADIRKNMLMDSLTNDVSVAVNDQAIKDSVLNLVMTTRGERLYQPEIGGNISTLLFELMSPDTTYLLQRAIQEVITNWEPRAILEVVDVLADYDNNSYAITIRFYTKYNLEVSQSVNVNLASKAQAT